MDLNLHLLTAPTVLPVEVEELATHLRDTGEDQKAYMQDIILPSAVASVEKALSRSIMTQTWQWVFDGGFPATGILRMPRPPLQSVSSVKYIDVDSTTQTWDSGNYHVETKGQYGRLWLADGISWPTDLLLSRPGVATIEYVAGYGDQQDKVPAGIRGLVLLMAAHLFNHREILLVGTSIVDIPHTWDALVMQHRALRWDSPI